MNSSSADFDESDEGIHALTFETFESYFTRLRGRYYVAFDVCGDLVMNEAIDRVYRQYFPTTSDVVKSTLYLLHHKLIGPENSYETFYRQLLEFTNCCECFEVAYERIWKYVYARVSKGITDDQQLRLARIYSFFEVERMIDWSDSE